MSITFNITAPDLDASIPYQSFTWEDVLYPELSYDYEFSAYCAAVRQAFDMEVEATDEDDTLNFQFELFSSEEEELSAKIDNDFAAMQVELDKLLAQISDWYKKTAPSTIQIHSPVSLVSVQVEGNDVVEVDVDTWSNQCYFPTGKVYLEPGKVYDCPRHGEEAIEFLYGADNVFITVETLAKLLREGKITISQK